PDRQSSVADQNPAGQRAVFPDFGSSNENAEPGVNNDAGSDLSSRMDENAGPDHGPLAKEEGEEPQKSAPQGEPDVSRPVAEPVGQNRPHAQVAQRSDGLNDTMSLPGVVFPVGNTRA